MPTQPNDTLSATNLVSHIDNTPLAIIVWDINNRVTFWSRRATAIFGWEPVETLGRKALDLNLIHEEDLKAVKLVIEAIYKGETNFNQSVNRNYTRSGKVIFCEWYNSALKDEKGQVTSVLSLVQDITQRKLNEVALQKSQQQLSLIYNSAIDPMWLIDIEGKDQFRFIDINTTFTTVTGLTRSQVIGKLIEEVLPVASHQLVRTKYNEAIQTGNIIDYIEVADLPAGKRVGEIRVIPIRDLDGNITKLVGIANDRTERSKAEEGLNELNQQLRDLATRTQEVLEEERAEIAREIHDELGQQLTAVKMDIAWVAQKGNINDASIYDRLTNAMELLDITVNSVRRIAMDLRPSILDDLGLQEALYWFVQEFENKSGIACVVKINDQVEKIAPPIAITLFRVVQEALTNIRRHAKANNVLVELNVSDTQVSLKVTDDGQGFDVNTYSRKKTLGLLGMEERIHKQKGEFQIQSVPGKGTTIFVIVPKTMGG